MYQWIHHSAHSQPSPCGTFGCLGGEVDFVSREIILDTLSMYGRETHKPCQTKLHQSHGDPASKVRRRAATSIPKFKVLLVHLHHWSTRPPSCRIDANFVKSKEQLSCSCSLSQTAGRSDSSHARAATSRGHGRRPFLCGGISQDL